MDEERKVTMNEALRRWINEEKRNNKNFAAIEEKDKKHPKGMCQLCGEKKAITSCIKCGRMVCKSCHFKIINVCKKCVPPEIAGKWDGSSPDWEKELGVEWIE